MAKFRVHALITMQLCSENLGYFYVIHAYGNMFLNTFANNGNSNTEHIPGIRYT